MDEFDMVRAQERQRIARYLKNIGDRLLRDPDGDAIDGYVAATILSLADVIKTNGETTPSCLTRR